VSELVTLEDAFAAAAAEQDSAPSEDDSTLDAETSVNEVIEQATEDSSTSAGEVEELFELAEEGTSAPPAQIDVASMLFEIPGEEAPKTAQELVNGYLRQKDYTQKTQVIAEQRKTNERAIKLWETIQADPAGVARQIAEEAGLIQPGASPARAMEFSVFKTEEAVEAEIQRRVDMEVQKHPAVVEANVERSRRWVQSEFDRIETSHGVKLGPKSRQTILRVASDRGVGDLELVYRALMQERAERSHEAQRLAAAAPGRPTGRAGTATGPTTEIDSISDAFELAFAGM
jgi:hypothetical protein